MSIIPNTVCRRCHRQYPSIRSRCPYCGTSRPREVRRVVPESDSVVRGTAASRNAVEDRKWQLIIGGVLLLCVLIAVTSVVAINLNSRVDDGATITASSREENPVIEAETTAVPPITPTPSPSPSPTPGVTSISITYAGSPMEGFMEGTGTQIDLDATAYPISDGVTIEWSSSDESCATVDEDGVVTVVGGYGTSCQIIASVGDVQAVCNVWGK